MAHKCGETSLKCFDCRKPICRDCMVELPNSIVCKACKPKPKSARFFPFYDCAILLVASLFYSFIAFSLFGFIGRVDVGLCAIFAAVIGVGISELLDRIVLRIRARAIQLTVVIIGLIGGEVIGANMRMLLHHDPLTNFFSQPFGFPSAIYLVIIILAVIARFRT